jgi:hypothetical protein
MCVDSYQRAHKICSKVIMLKLRKEFREYFIYKIYTELLNYLGRNFVFADTYQRAHKSCSKAIMLKHLKELENIIVTKYTLSC